MQMNGTMIKVGRIPFSRQQYPRTSRFLPRIYLFGECNPKALSICMWRDLRTFRDVLSTRLNQSTGCVSCRFFKWPAFRPVRFAGYRTWIWVFVKSVLRKCITHLEMSLDMFFFLFMIAWERTIFHHSIQNPTTWWEIICFLDESRHF